jgi:hypothetical protein
MALNAGVILGFLTANRASGGFSFGGSNYDKLALGIATGVNQWGVGQFFNLGLTGAATGLAGVGTILPPVTRIIVPPNSGTVLAALTGAGMNGSLSKSLAVSVAMGISQAFTSAAQYTGPATGVSIGVDVAKITVANAAMLIGILRGTLGGMLGNGPALNMMAIGLGNGITSLLLQGTGVGQVTGTPTVPPAPGSGPTPTSMVV